LLSLFVLNFECSVGKKNHEQKWKVLWGVLVGFDEEYIYTNVENGTNNATKCSAVATKFKWRF